MVLSPGESHHLATVLRAVPGDRFELFDGRGRRALAEVVIADSIASRLVIVAELPAADSDRGDLVLATAVPKGERFDWLIEKATELGVSRLVPIISARSVVEPRETKLERLRATVIAAAKQCGRTRLMELAPVQSWRQVVDQWIPGMAAVIAHPDGGDLATVWGTASFETGCFALIGPEGGFTEEEVADAEAAGAIPVSLGPTLLRTETAAIAIAAAWALRSPRRPG